MARQLAVARDVADDGAESEPVVHAPAPLVPLDDAGIVHFGVDENARRVVLQIGEQQRVDRGVGLPQQRRTRW